MFQRITRRTKKSRVRRDSGSVEREFLGYDDDRLSERTRVEFRRLSTVLLRMVAPVCEARSYRRSGIEHDGYATVNSPRHAGSEILQKQ